MNVEIWSDVACPWCYLGKRHLEEALGRWSGEDVAVTWRSFQLQPDAPRFGEPGAGAPTRETLVARGYSPEQLAESQARLTAMAGDAGLEYHLDRGRSANTFDAHALIKAADRQGRGDAMVERLFKAQHEEGLRLDDPEVLTRLAAEVGLEGDAAVPTDEDREAVAEDFELARGIGVNGVPFFVFDRRLALSGAQPAEVILQAMEQAASADAPA
jgi:predicted DsbA family dithiol-disulfide isomerase